MPRYGLAIKGGIRQAPASRRKPPLQRRVIGFDINSKQLEELRQGIDRTNETSAKELENREAAGIV